MENALYLIPVTLGETEYSKVLPDYNFQVISQIRHFIVENIRSARRFLKKVENELADMFIVSEVTVSEGEPENAGEFGVGIKISAADGDKCERCWKFDKSVGTDSEHPTLCKRCADVIRLM